MGEIEENWQPAKFYCSEIKLIYSINSHYSLWSHNVRQMFILFISESFMYFTFKLFFNMLEKTHDT